MYIYIYIYIYVHVCMYVCIHVCMYVYRCNIDMCMYMHIYTSNAYIYFKQMRSKNIFMCVYVDHKHFMHTYYI